MTRWHSLKRITAAFVALILGVAFLSGCEEQGPLEEAGEKADEALKDAKRAVEDAKD